MAVLERVWAPLLGVDREHFGLWIKEDALSDTLRLSGYRACLLFLYQLKDQHTSSGIVVACPLCHHHWMAEIPEWRWGSDSPGGCWQMAWVAGLPGSSLTWLLALLLACVRESSPARNGRSTEAKRKNENWANKTFKCLKKLWFYRLQKLIAKIIKCCPKIWLTYIKRPPFMSSV